MEKETIFYNILYQDALASSLIPELNEAYNMSPHRISKNGETVVIPISRTIGALLCAPGASYIHPIIELDNIRLTWETNTTNATRVARIILLYCDPSGCKKILQFAIHQN